MAKKLSLTEGSFKANASNIGSVMIQVAILIGVSMYNLNMLKLMGGHYQTEE